MNNILEEKLDYIEPIISAIQYDVDEDKHEYGKQYGSNCSSGGCCYADRDSATW